ncbi:MAG TPA: hypothetical protein VIO61_16085 [Anaerolineaceae bacterium]
MTGTGKRREAVEQVRKVFDVGSERVPGDKASKVDATTQASEVE